MQRLLEPNNICRKCGGSLIVKKHNYHKPFNRNQVYYYLQYDYCKKCKAVYLDSYYMRKVPKDDIRITTDGKEISAFWELFHKHQSLGYANKDAFKKCLTDLKYRPPEK